MNRLSRNPGLVAALALLSGCVSLKTPDGYAERSRTGEYEYQAISTDASVIAVAKYDNEDEDKGTLAYWAEAARKQLVLSRGYTFEEQGEFHCSRGPGRWMRFARKYRGTDYLYLLGLVVDGDEIYALEAGGEKAVFNKDVPRVLEAFATLN
ncbi:MAG: hypothetical protein JXR96_30020 [Deltaproteobacteria bacterium]|nr:hypothetical protein [Deltaproteobacteria bacterium]